MKKFRIPTYLVLFLLGTTALWYFGHHRPAQKILKAEPKKVYKAVPLALKTTTGEQQAPEVAHTSADEATGHETQTLSSTTMKNSTAPSRSDTTDTEDTVASQTDVLTQGTVTPRTTTETSGCASHEADPAAAARLEAAKLELLLAQEYSKEAKAKMEAEVIPYVNLLNAMSPEEQREHWEKYRNVLVNHVMPLLEDDEPGFDPDEYIQMFIDTLIEYGYQPRY